MNQDQIIQWAREAGMCEALNHGSGSCVWTEGCNGVSQQHLERFASLVRSAALDEAAVVCERLAREDYGMVNSLHEYGECAADIRSLKGTT
jgi:hypothetical protein